MKGLLCTLMMLFALVSMGQDVQQKVANLGRLMKEGNGYLELTDVSDPRIAEVNDSISTLLLQVLNNPEALTLNLDSLLPSLHPASGNVHLYSIYHNSGGSMHGYFTILNYRDKDTTWAISLSDSLMDESNFYELYELHATDLPCYLLLAKLNHGTLVTYTAYVMLIDMGGFVSLLPTAITFRKGNGYMDFDEELQTLTYSYTILPGDPQLDDDHQLSEIAKIEDDGLYHFADYITFDEAFIIQFEP